MLPQYKVHGDHPGHFAFRLFHAHFRAPHSSLPTLERKRDSRHWSPWNQTRPCSAIQILALANAGFPHQESRLESNWASRYFLFFFPIRSGLKPGTNYNCSYSLVDDDSGLEPRILKLELEEPVEMEIPGLEKTQDEHPDWGGQSSWKVVYPFVAIVHTRI